MREAVKIKLNTSIVVEPPTNLEHIEPILHQASQMEHIQEHESNDYVERKKKKKKKKKCVKRTKKIECKYNIKSNVISTNKNILETLLETHSASNDTLISTKNENKRTKKNEVVAVKKEKAAKKVKIIVAPNNDDGTSSPLPGLLVEESKPKCKDDINDSLNTNMLQKFKKVFRDGPEANDSALTQNMLSDVETQNMLSDVEKLNSSAQNYNSLLDEICFVDYDKKVAETAKKQNTKALKPNKKVAKKKIETTIDKVIEIQDSNSVFDRQSGKSIATEDITAHGDEDEVTPATESIVETFQPREFQDLGQAMKDYFTKLTREIHDSSKGSVESNKSAKGTREVDNTSARSPVVSVKRLSLEDISKWMPSRRTSDTDSPPASSKIKSAKKNCETPSGAESSVENTPRVKDKTAEISKPVKSRRDTYKPVKIVGPKSPAADLVKLKLPSIAITRISLEEFNKWLSPMPVSEEEKSSSSIKPRRELKLIYSTRSKSQINNKEIRNVTQKEKSYTKTAEDHKPVKTIIQTDTNDSDNIDTNVASIRPRLRLTRREATRKRKLIDSDTEQAKESKKKEQIKSNTKTAPSKTTLKEKLAALPRFPRFDKELVSVVAEPSLSKVSECPELNNCGVKSAFQRKAFPKPPPPEAKSRSDGETPRPRNRGGRRKLYPVVSDDNTASLLQAGPDYTAINETIESLPKDYAGENIVDALSREAMLAIPSKYDGGINTYEKKSQEESEAIDDTPNEIREAWNQVPYKLPCNISTTDDESNTEAVNETPAIVCRKKKPTPNIEEKQTFDVKTVEEFFSQHVAENQTGEIVISPRLAMKINETSSETSDNYFDDNDLLNEEIHTDIEQRIFDDAAIIDCLNEMIDTVCRDFDNYTEDLFQDNITASIDHQDDVDLSNVKYVAKPKPTQKAKNIKLKYKPAKKAKPRATKKSKAVQQKNTKKMSTIIEQKDEEINQKSEDGVEVVKIINPKKTETPKSNNKETPPIRRKRKLYSPTDDVIEEDVLQYNKENTSDDAPLSNFKEIYSSKAQANAICYKEIEKHTRLPRTRKSKGKITEPSSPRTAKMNTAFDNLKEKNESNETIRLASKGDNVYNFSSDSEDEDFKKKKIEIKKRISVGPKAKGKNTRRGKGSDTSYEDTNKTKPVKRKIVDKRTTKQIALEKVAVVDLIKMSDLVDEKMREAVKEKLNTSFVVEPPTNLEHVELESILHQAPQMEHIQESESNDNVVTKKRTKKTERKNNIESNDISTKKNISETLLEKHDSASNDTLISKKNENKRTKKNKVVAVKKEKAAKKVKTTVVPDNDDGTSSPLPGLLVEESKPKCKDDINDSLNTNMLQKFKKVFRDGPEANDSALTQNMLSDVEKLNSSAQNYNSLLDEICFVDYDKKVAETAKKQNTKALKPNKKVAKKKIETTIDKVIEIQDSNSVFDRQSGKSIATEGITAHGDEDEVPPATESIVETFQPRELQDMSQAMKDYFTKLTRVLHDSSKDSVESNKSTKGTSEVDDTSARSPVVSVKRLSLEDISKWMPSRRTSDTDSPPASSKIKSANKNCETPSGAESSVENTPRVKDKTAEISKPVKSRRDTYKPVKIVGPKSPAADLVKLKLPSLAITRISLEEFNKWLPPMPVSEEEKSSSPKKPRRELKIIYSTRSKSKINNKEIRNVTQKEKSFTKTAEVHKPVQTIIQTDTNDSDNIDTNVSSIRPRLRLTRREATRKRKLIDSDTEQARPKKSKNEEQRNTKTAPSKTTVRKSKISPIKLFDFTPILDAGNSSVDENVTNLRTTNVLSKSKESQLRKSKSNVSKSDTIISSETSKPETPELRKRKCKSPFLSVSKKKSVEPQTRFEEIKASEKPKKYIIEPKRLFDDTIKQLRVLEDVTMARSGPSSSSVNDWFDKTEPVVIDPKLSLKDTIQNVMERLDTTLVEINHNTSKKFVTLFVEAQTELDVFSEQFSKSLALVESFKEKFKTQALELMHYDCQQRRAMVELLKDDVQAVLDHMDKEED